MTATSNPFIKLLGETLVNNKLGKVQTDDLSSNEVVGLYFSAHWCGPCRGFTPKLIESYNKMKADGKKLEIVFVSADRSDGDFAKYFGTMPWLAVPFENTEIIDKLNSKYQVRGIPTLIFLKNDGKILSKDGRDVIAEDPTGKDFPWPPKNVLDLLAGDVVDHQDKHIPVSEILKTNDAIGIYFSAHWCPPCRAFTPILASLYKKLTAEGKKFEILFASSDKSQKEFNEYFHEMPWKAIPFPDRERKEKLSRFFGVEGIPTFIMLDPSGKIINDNARGEASEDPEGKNFPWPAPEPVPLNQLNSPLVEKINEAPTFLILLDKTENSQVQSYVDLVQPIAAEIFNKNKTLDEDDDTPRMIFFYGTKDHEMSANLRGFFNPKNQTEPLILISDIPSQKKYLFQDKEVNATTIKNFVEGYFSKTLQGVGIKS